MSSRIARMCSILLLIPGLTGPAAVISQGTGFVRASGQRIVDGNGQDLLLKGMGLGGWLLQEGYMLNMQSFANAEWEIRGRIEDLIGVANADEFYRRYRKNFFQRKDLDSLKRWGFNSVRLPMNYKLLTPLGQPGVYLESGFATIDTLLTWCEANRMYLILDLHSAPGGQSAGPIADYAGFPSLWESADYRTRTVELWRTIASRYADKPWIGGYDVLNETAWDLGPGNVPLRDLLVAITQAIRSVDSNHVIFAEGNWYATDFGGLTPPWDNNMAYSFHKYWNDPTAGTISYLVNMRTANNVPLWLGETGENSNEWFTRCVELMSNSGIGWAWWPHKKFNAISSPFSVPHTQAYENLLKYWQGQAARPSLQEATAALFGMADRLDSDSCVVNRGVIEALFTQPFQAIVSPFTAHTIPGRVFASDFDLGRQGSAYWDSGFQNTGSGAYNNGWRYRNDGVDIFSCSDTVTNGYYVGDIASGEYLNFTVDVARTDTYHVALRYAGNTAGGKVLFRWDGLDISPFLDVPVTGGWEVWRTMPLGRTVFTEGRHTLRMVFAFGGFNVNYIEMTSTTAGTDTGETETPVTYALSQNFPNPFNPGTKIRYHLPERAIIRLEVLNVLGQVVAVVASGEKGAGTGEAEWIPNAPAGVYFYRLTAASVAEPSRRFDTVRKMMLLK